MRYTTNSLKHQRLLKYLPLFGEYDLIAKIKAEDYEKLGKIVSKIRSIEGIINTKTLTGVRF